MTWKRVVVVLLIKLGVLVALTAIIGVLLVITVGGMALTGALIDEYIIELDPGTTTGFVMIFVICAPFIYMMGHAWKILERYHWFQNLNKLFTFPITDYLRPK